MQGARKEQWEKVGDWMRFEEHMMADGTPRQRQARQDS